MRSRGFTITELVIVMALLGVLLSLGSITLLNSYRKPVQRNMQDILIADVRAEQMNAMTTDSYYGIHFETTTYTLFKGGTYSVNDSSNFVVNLDEGYKFTGITLPSSQIIFSPYSGDINGWIAGSDAVSIEDSSNTIVATLKINKYGATY